VQVWANASAVTCVSLTSAAADFATGANQAAWVASGFLPRPTPNSGPRNGCFGKFHGQQAYGFGPIGAIDVSGLPVEPKTLALDLINGTTGVPSIDQLPTGQGIVPGFERAAAILTGPTIGATPSFNAALLRGLALIPGIVPVGEMTSHQRRVGLGFSANSPYGRSWIIVDPATGELLEARNVPDIVSEQSVEHAFESSLSAPNGYGIREATVWLDPVSGPTDVSTVSLPAAIAASIPPAR
jgi:hypothetical protein